METIKVFILFYFFNVSKCTITITHADISTEIMTSKNPTYDLSLFMNLKTDSSSDEEKLLKYLLKDYNPNIMPKLNMSDNFKLFFGLAMSQLINIYDKEQVMKTNVWLHLYWNDPYLQWNSIQEFNHITSIRLPYDKIWTPDIILYNNAHGKYDVSYKSNVVIYQQGAILWIPPAIYKSSCQIDVEFFPFDEQICEMIFGSWIYNSDELVLDYFENMRNVDLNDYVPSGTWDIIDVPASIVYYNDTVTNKTKVQMVYKIKMRRKSLFYMVNIIIPTILLSSLSVCVFFLPTDDGEKITLSLGAMFALVVFFLLIAKIMPPTSNSVPLISKYLLFTFIMNILSVLNTCIVISLYYKKFEMETIHPWIKKIILKYLAFLLFIKRKNLETSLYEESDILTESQFSQRTSPGILKSKSIYFKNLNENVDRYLGQNLDSPIVPIYLANTLEQKEKNVNIKDKNKDLIDFPLKKTYRSYHDLILEQNKKSNKPSTQTILLKYSQKSTSINTINSRTKCDNRNLIAISNDESNLKLCSKSTLYNLNKLNKPSDLKIKIVNDSQSLINSNDNLRKHSVNKKDITKKDPFSTSKNVITLASIRPTESLLRACSSIDYIATFMKAKDDIDRIKEDWKYLASILDRLMLIIFFVVTLWGTYYSLYSGPSIFDNNSLTQENLIRQNSHQLSKVNAINIDLAKK